MKFETNLRSLLFAGCEVTFHSRIEDGHRWATVYLPSGVSISFRYKEAPDLIMECMSNFGEAEHVEDWEIP